MFSILSNSFFSISATNFCKIISQYLMLDFAILKNSTKLVFFLSAMYVFSVSKDDENMQKKL